MGQPYENILLGNFILTIGYLSGQRGIKLNRTVLQLLQQTPDDCTVGDLFANLQGQNFIFEFKRNESQVKSEFKKPNRFRLMELLKNTSFVSEKKVSQKCHFMCFPAQSTTTTLLFMPYALIQDARCQDRKSSFELSYFCEKLLVLNTGFGASYSEFSQYLNLLAGFPDHAGGSGGGAGAIMNVSNSGAITIVEFDDLRVLAKTLGNERESPTLTRTNMPSRGFEL